MRPFPSATWGVFYNQVSLKPHQSRSWLTSEPDEAADENMADVTNLSLQAPALLHARERVVSTDEMTGIQALARTHPTIPMGPGRVERREFAYTRHGTLTRIANVAGAQGRVVTPSMGATRTEEDFVTPIARTVASDPEATWWHVAVDHLNTHQSATLVRCVAKHDGIKDDLGQKGTRGMLKSMATRAALLVRSDASHGVPLDAQTCLVDAPGRDVVQHPGSQAPATRQFDLAREFASQGVDVYRRLQCDYGQAVQMVLWTPTTERSNRYVTSARLY